MSNGSNRSNTVTAKAPHRSRLGVGGCETSDLEPAPGTQRSLAVFSAWCKARVVYVLTSAAPAPGRTKRAMTHLFRHRGRVPAVLRGTRAGDLGRGGPGQLWVHVLPAAQGPFVCHVGRSRTSAPVMCLAHGSCQASRTLGDHGAAYTDQMAECRILFACGTLCRFGRSVTVRTPLATSKPAMSRVNNGCIKRLPTSTT
jgi:hypothetical protein